MDFTAGSVYQGTIIKQVFSINDKTEVPQLALTVKLEGKLVNIRRPSAGLLPAPSIEVDTLVRFPADNEQSLLISLEHMTKLGFDSDDLEMLNPAKPGHFSCVGKKVCVAPKPYTKNETTEVYWNLRFPTEYKAPPVAVGAVNRSPAAAAYKELIARRKQEAAAKTDPTSLATSAVAGGTQDEVPF